MKTDEVRERFLEFFRQRDHRIVPPDSLVPQHDPTLLFTGAGMNQFKDEFYGRGDRALKRAATCQKCLRTGDIERVGKTASHHTFFEMLGNFSFGDYFKEEAILWAWEFMRQEMSVPTEKMVASIYGDDDESEKIWLDLVGLPPGRLYKYGADENYWPPNAQAEGPNGPCGPCSEIFYDKGEELGCGQPGCNPSCDCGRYVEVWNLVFQQYDRKEGGVLDPLPMRNIDTGMGLERMARVMQGVETNYDIDIFRPIMDEIASVCGLSYPTSGSCDQCMRRIADHARAVVFCIADGVIPSNEERGYVVRRLLRRAIRDALQLGVEAPFFARLVEPVVTVFQRAYPELEEGKSHIATVVANEEEAFGRTVKRGSAVLDNYIAELKRGKGTVMRGAQVFDLYQTYGFPVEMTESILREQAMSVDMQGFLAEMGKHQKLSKEKTAFQEGAFVGGPIAQLQEKCAATEFTGYRTLESEARVIGIIVEDELAGSVGEGQEAVVVLDRTPAYGEAGGQVGDRGVIRAAQGEPARFTFDHVRREKGFFLHGGRMESGRLTTGDGVSCQVDKENRLAIARNHTATHLLHYALRTVLGPHAAQSGSHVSNEKLRFDFSNPTELSKEELQRVEDIVNEKIMEDEPVVATRMSLSEAKETGAIALFGEKYGDIVRVMSTGDYSRELCGGTHCKRTGEVGVFRIISEASVAGGVRRIEAVTGHAAIERSREKEARILRLCGILRTQEEELERRCHEMLDQIRQLNRDLHRQRQESMRQLARGRLLDEAEQMGDARVVVARLGGGHAELRSAADALRKNNRGIVCVLASDEDGKVALVAGLSRDMVERGLNARSLLREAARIVGGGEGGRDDLAQAGGSDVERLDEAFDAIRQALREELAG